MKIVKSDGTYLKESVTLERQHLLLIDDLGLQTIDAQSLSVLTEIIEERH